MAAVTVRAFGALRELVPTTCEVEADDVASLVAVLTLRLGPEFTRRMQRATVVVDDEVVAVDDDHRLTDGATVVLLPPFAGG